MSKNSTSQPLKRIKCKRIIAGAPNDKRQIPFQVEFDYVIYHHGFNCARIPNVIKICSSQTKMV